jgi:hypothetical protein
MRDLFGTEIIEKPVRINIYADEVQSKECPYTKEKWHYIGIIVEDVENPLLDDIINERYCNNFDIKSPFYVKNDRIVHWSELNGWDAKNICKRWFEYILNPVKSEKKFYSYILGINDSKLNRKEFDPKGQFNSKYNRFFRSAVLYALKTFFPKKKIIVENIFHETGQQQQDEYFPWHCVYKIQKKEKNISFNFDKIIFLPKSHREDRRANLIQLCDIFLGVCTNIIHGIEKSRRSEYRIELIDLFFPLFKRMINESYNKQSYYKHSGRIMTRFFPKENTIFGDIRRLINQFYTERKLYYEEQNSKQLPLFK